MVCTSVVVADLLRFQSRYTPGATIAKWLFPQEKATSHNPRIWVHELWNRSKGQLSAGTTGVAASASIGMALDRQGIDK